MKLIAYYLPQYHSTEYNDRWWGKGFTDWDAARNAAPLFPEHNQPHLPQNGNYYNLLEKETMVRQAEQMHAAHIHGMCFYHYYFKDGQKALEKPAENLLQWTDIDMPFCFSWANGPWARSWSNISEKNVWIKYGENDTTRAADPKGILFAQDYGSEKDWEAHFYYLLPFFRDNRYLTIDGKPMFVIYKPAIIDCLPQMMECWNRLAHENQLPGIYFVAENAFESKGFDAYIYHEPHYTFEQFKDCSRTHQGVKAYYEYEDIWDAIVHRALPSKEKVIFAGGFTGYDDTPRRGSGGNIVAHADPDVYRNHLAMLLNRSEKAGSQYVFINAWNEWGEGMYLEPDEQYADAFLKATAWAMTHYHEADCPLTYSRSGAELSEKAARYYENWHILHDWMILKEEGISVADYLHEIGLHHVIIYGIGMLGMHLVKELEKSGITVSFGIDKRAHSLCLSFPVYTIDEVTDEQMLAADAIIVTATYDFAIIYKELRGRFPVRTESLSTIISGTLHSREN